MKSRLLSLISRTIELLVDCGWRDKAKWFSEIRNSIDKAEPGSDEYYENLNRLDNALSGMGSFSDLPLASKTSKMSDQEVRDMQWKLADLIGDTIEKIRRKSGVK